MKPSNHTLNLHKSTNLPWLSPTENSTQNWTVVKVKVTLRLTVNQSVNLGIEPHLGPTTRYLFLSESYVLVSVGRPLWREDGSVFCICRWPCQLSLSRVLVPWDLQPYFTVSDLRLSISCLPEHCIATVAAHPLENSLSIVEVCLPSRCLATLWLLQYCNQVKMLWLSSMN
jgi:hypothetical protein